MPADRLSMSPALWRFPGAWVAGARCAAEPYTGNQSHSLCFLMKTQLRATSAAALVSSSCSCI